MLRNPKAFSMSEETHTRHPERSEDIVLKVKAESSHLSVIGIKRLTCFQDAVAEKNCLA
jgi:hypothetical protein